MKHKNKKFKPYQQNQMMALPPTFDELIDRNHPVRIVNQVIDEIDIDPLIKKYKGGGCSSYHPRMLLKVVVYGYLNNIYPSRKIEKAVLENIHFMWLAGMSRPDHNTINRFRTDRLKGVIKHVFSQVVLFMSEQGLVDLRKVYTDGTFIEANANRYSFVWGKNIKRYRENIVKQLEELWQYTERVAAEELKDSKPTSFENISAGEVKQVVNKIDKALKDKPKDKQINSKLKAAKKDWSGRIANYDKQKQIMGERNSYSKTDTDATFMRMKEDHLKNSQLKPAYNLQISTNDQIITNYSLHQKPSDTTTLKPHLALFEKHYGFLPQEVIADAGYGSEENYEYLDNNDVDGYVKYNWFDKEQRKTKKKSKGDFNVDNLYYNKELDCYYCPMGQPMTFKEKKKITTDNDYTRTIYLYQAQNCKGCPIRGVCNKKGEYNRTIQVSHKLNKFKAKARELLLSEKGIKHRSKRPVDVEPIFGFFKHNRGFRRFFLRGLEKVDIEIGLLSVASNLLKLVDMIDFPSDLNKTFCFNSFFTKKIAQISNFFKINLSLTKNPPKLEFINVN